MQHPTHPPCCQAHYQQQPNHQQPQYQQQEPPQYQHHPNNRPTNDPTYYDTMFNVKTREDDRTNKTGGNRNAFEYHLFAPKFQNTNGPQGPQARQPMGDTKRDQMNIFPTRMEERPTPATAPRASHPLQNRVIRADRVDDFNRTVDSMHVPEDVQRPVATRDMARSDLEARADAANKCVANRQFSLENLSGGLPLSGGGSFEDMFY